MTMSNDIEEQTDRLCRAIASSDLRAVQECLDQEKTDVNHRHCTKRTPLQIACVASSPGTVQLLVNHGARITARTQDGNTALHLAAARGNTDIIRIILVKSDQNKEIAQQNGLWISDSPTPVQFGVENDGYNNQEASDSVPLVNVKVDDEKDLAPNGNYLDHQHNSGLDVVDPDDVSWETFMSPLHVAILHGHVDVVKRLASFGADVRMPIKQYERVSLFGASPSTRKPQGAVLCLGLAFFLDQPLAHKMARTLLQLGASPALPDLYRTTPLHYVAAMKDTIPLEIFLETSREDTIRAMSQLSLTGKSMGVIGGSTTYSALTTAIFAGNPDSALEFLNAGANPMIEPVAVASTLNSAFPGRRAMFSTPKLHYENAKDFQLTPQPLTAAIKKEYPILALHVLDQGADPDTHKHWSHGGGLSVLDITRQKIWDMREFLSHSCTPEKDPRPPTLFPDHDADFLDGLKSGSYRFWATDLTLSRARQHFNGLYANYEAKANENVNVEGKDEKRRIIEDRLIEFELLEQELLSRKAKLFCELHPEDQDFRNKKKPAKSEQRRSYEPILFYNFDRKTGDQYISLFEAAWTGDINIIKDLALNWQNGSEQEPPLSLGERDCLGFTPLELAILRGHWDITNEIIDILHAQHKPFKRHSRHCGYNSEDEDMQEPPETDDDNASSSGSDCDDDSDSEGRSAKRQKMDAVKYVKLRASPLSIALLQPCPAYLFTEKSKEMDKFRAWKRWDDTEVILTDNSHPEQKMNLIDHAVMTNDIELLRSLLSMARNITDRDHRHRKLDSVLNPSFLLALKLGRIECLSMIVEKSGAGLFAQGDSEEEDPLHAPRTNHNKSALLVAAMEGNLEATRWMMGPDAIEQYVKYIKAHGDDPRVSEFVKSGDEIEKCVMKWLHGTDNLVLHWAIKSKPCAESELLIRYLIKRYPEYMETRTQELYTPLCLAFAFGQIRFARILLDAGADLTVKDRIGRNLLHLLLVRPYMDKNDTDQVICKSSALLLGMLEMLNSKLISTMLTERDKRQHQTPLMEWLSRSSEAYLGYPSFPGTTTWPDPDSHERLEIVKILLDHGDPINQDQLEISDNKGDFPVHVAVRKKFTGTVKLLLEHRPDLLSWENSFGKTAFDLANDQWAHLVLCQHHSPLKISAWVNPPSDSLVGRQPLSSVASELPLKFGQTRSHHQNILDVCRNLVIQTPHKRRVHLGKSDPPCSRKI